LVGVELEADTSDAGIATADGLAGFRVETRDPAVDGESVTAVDGAIALLLPDDDDEEEEEEEGAAVGATTVVRFSALGRGEMAALDNADGRMKLCAATKDCANTKSSFRSCSAAADSSDRSGGSGNSDVESFRCL
jgi:hypothetical protein